ncbi:TauD/TfdA dioxygenase family protein [Bradyrhizobium genosp. A]|uniref:TauD/TfdA dioxygenase family protein n=1 Tax=Bradyrhizobium genosp. A TaxID=83626 RepID=UPI003CF518CD
MTTTTAISPSKSSVTDSPTSPLVIMPISPTLGADVRNVELVDLVRDKSDVRVNKIREALNRHLVLRFRNTGLDVDGVAGFAALFGELITERRNPESYVSAHSTQFPDRPEVEVISNVVKDGRPVGDKGAHAQIWHMDGSHREKPAAYTLLYASKAPPKAPATGFMSTYSLYESLSHEFKAEISQLQVIHSIHNRSQAFWDFMEGPSASLEKRLNGRTHPLVAVHPTSKRPYVVLPRRRDALIVGYTPEQSRMILERVWAAIFNMRETIAIPLGTGDLVLFDNRSVLHNREGWNASDERVVLNLGMAPQAPIPAFP